MRGLFSLRMFAAAWCAASVLSSVGLEAGAAEPAEVRAAIESVIAMVVDRGGAVECRVGGWVGLVPRGFQIPEGEIQVLSISLYRSRITDDDLKQLAPLADMKTLSLVLAQTGITDAGLAHLGVLKGMTQLFLDETKITDAGLKHLTPLKKLQILALQKTQLTDEGMNDLAGCESVTMLWLSETKVTDVGLAQVAKLPNLIQLSLHKTGVTKVGIEGFQNSKALVALILSQCELTDADVDSLTKLTRLKVLNVTETKLTEAGIERLEKGLPTTKVVSSRVAVSVPATTPPVRVRQAAATPGAQAASAIKIAGNFVRPAPIEVVVGSPPVFLKGATVYYYPSFLIVPNPGVLEVEIEQDTALYVAVRYDPENPPGRPAAAPETPTATYRQMNRDCWVDVGTVNIPKKTGPRFDLFWKQFSKGDKLHFGISAHSRPLLITPASPDSNPLEMVPNATMETEQARMTTRSKVERLLRLRKFDELEAMVAGFRRDKTYDRDGQCLLRTFYEATTPYEDSDAERHVIYKLLDEWLAAKPQSAAPHYALADFWSESAWIARNGGADRSEEAFARQRECYRQVRLILEDAAQLSERDPYYFHLRGEMLLYQGGTVEQIEKAFADSLKLDPDFLFPLTEGGRYYQPRWNGGEMEKYAARCADWTKERHGDSAYTLCAISEADDDGLARPKDYGFDWSRMKRGFADLRKRFPDSIEYDKWNCKFAAFFEDWSEADAAFKRLERHPAGTYALDSEMLKWRQQARRAAAK